MKPEKWQRIHTWRSTFPYEDVYGNIAAATITLSSQDKVDVKDIYSAVSEWGRDTLGYKLPTEHVDLILSAGKHGFA